MAGLDFSNGSMDWGSLEKNLGANVTSGGKKNYDDDRFWKLSRDENDNGGAIIRLLPDPTGTPFIQRYNHAFQSFDNVNKKKRWYINISPETIGEPCPASELWSALYNIGTEEGKKEAKKFSRKIKFMANIKVIKDPSNPQNEGKIFLWEFGTKLKDKFMAALQPSDSEIAMGEEPKQLFNPLTGCNVKLKISKVAGFLNYDATEIMTPSSVYTDGEEAKTDIIDNAFKLEEFMKPEAFETYEELKTKMKFVLEAYQPEFVDPIQFKNVVAGIVGATTNTDTSAPVQPVAETPVQPVQPVQETPAQPTAPVAETAPAQPVQPVQPVAETQPTQPAPAASASSDLDFLDDL